jgi:hypothetical protein
MGDVQVTRELLPGGAVRLSSGDASFEFRRPGPGALLVIITGVDRGQFGLAALDEIAAALNREGALELFVNARDAAGAAVSVSDEWARFFAVHRERLRQVHVLPGSKALKLTVAIAQHLSRTGDLIHIYSDPQIFAARLASAQQPRESSRAVVEERPGSVRRTSP